MPGLFQKLAARTLGSGTQLVKPIVPSVFANDGAIEPASAPLVQEPAPGSPAQGATQPLAEPVPFARKTKTEIPRDAVPRSVERKPMSLHDAVEAIFSKEERQPILVPVAPIAAVSNPPTVTPVSPREEAPRVNGQTAPIARRTSETTPKQTPSIRVTIGRVEVKAEFPAPPAAPVASRPALPPALTLDEYRRQRDRGLR